MQVREVMTGNVKSCRPVTNLAEAAKIMWDNDCGVLPAVNDEGKIIGTITDRDIAIAVGTKNRLASDITVGEIIPHQVFTTTPDEDIKSALNIMRDARVRRLPVVDGNGVLQGILSMNDIVLRAKPGLPDLSYEDVLNTFKAICEHQTTRAAVA